MRLGLMLSVVLWSAIAVIASVALTGCTFQVGIGYRGKTGIDDRQSSQLVRYAGGAIGSDDEYRAGKSGR